MSWYPTPESARRQPSRNHTVADFDNLFATNVRSPFFLIQQLLPILREGSNIIVISSVGARFVVGKPGLDNPSILAYASIKGALETLVKNWAAILGPRGIRVNAVAPGVIDTDMFVEARVSSPMVPLTLLSSRSFSGANLLTLFLYAALGIFFFLFPMSLKKTNAMPSPVGRLINCSFAWARVNSPALRTVFCKSLTILCCWSMGNLE